jgi:hypothetical protein
MPARLSIPTAHMAQMADMGVTCGDSARVR